MPVDKDINLDKPLTDEEIRQLEEEADRLEELSQKAHDDAENAEDLLKKEEKILDQAVKTQEKIDKEAEKAEKARLKIGKTIKEINQLAEHRTALARFGGAEEFEEREEARIGAVTPEVVLPTGGRRVSQQVEKGPLGNILRQQESFREKMERLEKELADEKKRVVENKKLISDFNSKIQESVSMAQNPFGFLTSRMTGMLGSAGVAGFLAVIGIAVAQQVFEMVKEQFGPGGAFDVRKEMLDRDREIIELQHIIDRRAGRVFFTSDVELQQSAPDTSNTEKLRDRMVRYQALHLGE